MICTLWQVEHPWEHRARLFSTQLTPSVCLFALKQFAPCCSSRPSWLSSQHAHGNTCSLAANHYFDHGHAVKIESVHAHPKHPYSHTNCHCKYPLGRPVVPWSCTSHLPVHVPLCIENWYVYRFLPAHYGEPPYKPTLGAYSLAICSQNRFW